MQTIMTNNSLGVIINGQMVTYPTSSPYMEQILQAIENEDVEVLLALKEITKQIVEGSAQFTTGGVIVAGVTVSLDTKQNKLHAFVEKLRNDGLDEEALDHISVFVQKMMANPYIDAVEELYDFCEAQDFVILEDGCFLAYKNVNNDYTSIYDGKTMHTIGTVVRESAFDTDRTQTCSKGLHFCSKGYLKHFRSPNCRTIVVKVDPADVVAIPTDYNNMKGRCRKYEVVGELKEENLKSYYRNNHG